MLTSDQLQIALTWLTPYLTSAAVTLGLLYTMLQTGLGSRIFDATFKHYFDRKLANLKYDQDRKLADLKHVYERGVEELRSELSQVTDRGIRSNEREYQALIASWENFIEAYYRTLSCTGRISSRPDLNSLSTDELTEYLESSLKHSSDRRYIKSAQDRNLAFGRVEQATLLNEAQTAIWEARSTLRKQSVFIPKGIDDHFERAFSILHKRELNNTSTSVHGAKFQ